MAVYVGAPEQPVKVAIDTAFSDFWVSPNCSNIDNDILVKQCESYGRYDPAKSSNSRNLGKFNNVAYSYDSMVNYTSFTDDITLTTGVVITGAEFGVANNSKGLLSGILGLGFGESSGNTDHHNFIDQLASQKITNSKAFSLAIGNGTEDDGAVIIFGGVDTKKFSGKLQATDILKIQSPSTLARYWIQMTAISVTQANGSSKSYPGGNIPVRLEIRDSLSYCLSTLLMLWRVILAQYGTLPLGLTW